MVLLNIQFLWEVNPYRFLEASLTVYQLTRTKIPETQHSGKFQFLVEITVPISDTLPVENVSGLFYIEGVLVEYGDTEVKSIFFGGTRLMLAALSAIPNRIFVFFLTGYKKDNKSTFTNVPNVTVKRTFAAFVGQIVQNDWMSEADDPL